MTTETTGSMRARASSYYGVLDGRTLATLALRRAASRLRREGLL